MPETVARDRLSKRTQRKLVRRKSIRKIILLVVLFLFLSIGGTAGAIMWNVNDTLNKVTEQTPGVINSPNSGVDTAFHHDKPISFVILGRDTRPETGTMNTDVIIVAVANPSTKKVSMVSMPRDTRVKIPGYRGYHKINAIYAKGEIARRKAERNGQVPAETGETLVKQTLKGVLGIPIEHYINIDFDGFRSVIDEMGGVEVNVERKLYYNDSTDGTHIDLNPGVQVLNGAQALDYVRHREDSRGFKFYSSDYDRNRRQQEVIKVVADKLTNLDELPKLFKLLEVAGEHVHTDLSKEQIIGLAMDFKGISASSLISLDNGGYWKAGYTYLDRDKFLAIRNSLRTEMNVMNHQITELNNSPIYEGDNGSSSTKEKTG
ncbi:LCP family protein [Brevibacillus laterosporus]|uniref:LCP family protein n=1 Tax=Brevibacillus laterosporus TaxID=1465 RepID=A0AAP3DK55_BRELA|nr:LCP family protein [Brevibacillus laterosporus]MCR8982408.1 LCP family protein [Brevibacillus laterosporus]MCZ0809563.1 LCP family protein [Brevibacillus laterosporus]MCZ0828095.1 LCP family protein [Brevibacillus laterosporus]MCZ0852106.1 LCP family protein [Brevibacillus laterosporus]